MRDKFLEYIFGFVNQANAIAVSGQRDLIAQVKADNSYVTNIDLQLSNLARRSLSELVDDRQIISEEHLDSFHQLMKGDAPQPFDLLIVIDPIDGTRNYAHKMPIYGVSIGVLQYGRPWLGVVAFPSLREVLYCDGEDVTYVRDVALKSETRQKLDSTEPALDRNSLLLSSHSFPKHYYWDHQTCELMVTGCSTINLCWPVLNRGVGCVFKGSLWDLAGSWPILRKSGFQIKGLQSGKELVEFSVADYDQQSLKLKETHLVCRPEHFKPLASSITKRPLMA